MARANKKPRAVARQEREAEAMMAAATQPRLMAVGDTPEEAALDPQPTVEDALAEEAEHQVELEQDPEQGEIEPAPEPADVWEQRYHTLKGKYDSEVPRLTGTVQGLNARLEALEAAASPTPAEAPQSGGLTPEADEGDRELYGDDFIELVERRAQVIADKAIARITPQLHKVSTEVAADRAQTAQERLHDKLTTAVPTWREINTSTGFLNWLNTPELYTGLPRLQLLRTAFGSGRSDQVVAIFQGYLRELAPASDVEPRTRRPGRPQLADLATPGKTRTSGRGPAEPLMPVPVTRADIQTFYSDVAKGNYKAHPEQHATMEARINAAVANGLVT
jgi:hypothetical protein